MDPEVNSRISILHGITIPPPSSSFAPKRYAKHQSAHHKILPNITSKQQQMRLESLYTLVAVLIITIVSADPDPRRCWRPGQPCSKLKRAVEDVSTILDEPIDTTSAEAEACFAANQPCAKARDAEASLRASIGKLDLDSDGGRKRNPKNEICEMEIPYFQRLGSGQIRLVLYTEAEADDYPGVDQAYCYSAGQQCDKVERAATTLAEALAQPFADDETYPRRCWRFGQRCGRC